MAKEYFAIKIGHPHSLGEVDPSLLDRVADVHAEQRKCYTVGSWTPETGMDNETLAPMEPLLSRVFEHENDIHNNAVANLVCDVLTATIPPSGVQIPTTDRWHYDAGGRFVFIQSALPTKLLYIPDGLSQDERAEAVNLLRASAVNIKHMNKDRNITRGLKLGMFAVFQAKPYEAFEMDNFVHMAPPNKTGQSINRAFSRIQIM